METMELTPLSEIVDKVWGKKGTPERDAMEVQLKEELNTYYVGEAIKKERLRQNLTQEELGEKIGVKKSQISKIESGRQAITLPTMSRVFRALGINSATLDLGMGRKGVLQNARRMRRRANHWGGLKAQLLRPAQGVALGWEQQLGLQPAPARA